MSIRKPPLPHLIGKKSYRSAVTKPRKSIVLTVAFWFFGVLQLLSLWTLFDAPPGKRDYSVLIINVVCSFMQFSLYQINKFE
jgi:hypothetical protein